MNSRPKLRVAMCGLGMIFDETYLPLFRRLLREPLYRRSFGAIDVVVRALVSQTGKRAEAALPPLSQGGNSPVNYAGPYAAIQMLQADDVDVICVATPDHVHFELAKAALLAGKHVLIEKPSVLALAEWCELVKIAADHGVLAKVVYHKLLDPDHKRLRTLVADGVLRHVNNGYCTLLEPKTISGTQFAPWIAGRNPATYVAVHYLKLIDFTFGSDWRLVRVQATGQRGQVGVADGPTWDSVQLRVTYQYPDQREATFDIHTDWVSPDRGPGAVDQEVQFRFDNGVWNAHQRKRGVEVVVDNAPAGTFRLNPNLHYNGSFLEPWGERARRGYGLEAIERFFEEVAFVEFGGPPAGRPIRLAEMRGLGYNDLAADRNVVAVVQALEAILREYAAGRPGTVVEPEKTGLMMRLPGRSEPIILDATPW